MIQRIVPVFLTLLAISAAAGASQPVRGYLDPKTDIFTPLAKPAPAPAATADPIIRQGVLEVTSTIAIDPSIPQVTTYFASVQAGTTDARFTTSVSSSASVTRSGNKGTVTIKLPYVFTVSSATDMVTISFQIISSASEEIELTETIPLPANGATTTVAIGEKA